MSKQLGGMLMMMAVLAAVPGWGTARADDTADKPAAGLSDDEKKMEFRANDMVNRGQDLIDAKEDDRGTKLLQSVPQMFPKAKARFRAYLALGKYLANKSQYDLAVKQFANLQDSEDPEERAEGLYQTGICRYNLNDYDNAFMDLRKVTSEYQWTVFANEAYYYIGQCHFKLGHWTKAIEALDMVGTSVPTNAKGQIFAEAGQRMYVKIYDKDLVVLAAQGQKPKVKMVAKSGDAEVVTLEPLGHSGEYWIGSIQTTLGDPAPGDGTLQITGGDDISVTYVDHNTEAGKIDQPLLESIHMVSTASIGFTDGAYREYTHGVFGDERAFLRVKDLDRSVSKNPGTITVRVFSQYTQVAQTQDASSPQPPADAVVGTAGADSTEPPTTVERSSVEVTLTETGSHTGIFTGTVIPHVAKSDAQIPKGDNQLYAVKGDDLVMEYVDESNMISRDPRTVTSSAKLLIGQIQDVKVEQRIVDSPDLKARKNLIEAQIYLKLGNIFKDVGLTNKAADKANEGLTRVDEVIGQGLKGQVDRSLTEEAFSVKWDLLLVKDQLAEAIAVCRTLTQLYPDSTLVDKALLKIGQAKAAGPQPSESFAIFNAIIALPKSDLKAEAQFDTAQTLEKMAVADAAHADREPALGPVMLAYKKCADLYPESPFAGDSLDKIANYYIQTKDYARAVELMQRVFQDYPDASFLDRMMLKWVIASYRMGDFATAKSKAEELLAQYPNSKEAEKARGFLDVMAKDGK